MKKFILTVIAAFVMATSLYGQLRSSNERTYILSEGYELLDRPTDKRLLTFKAPNGKYGFVTNTSCPMVRYLPVFESVITRTTLVGVKYKGKWGAVDTSMDADPDNRIVIECKYDDIEIMDEYRAKVTEKGHKWVIDIRTPNQRAYYGD